MEVIYSEYRNSLRKGKSNFVIRIIAAFTEEDAQKYLPEERKYGVYALSCDLPWKTIYVDSDDDIPLFGSALNCLQLIPSAYDYLLSRGGLAPAKEVEEEFYINELKEVAESKVIGETLHWVLKDD